MSAVNILKNFSFLFFLAALTNSAYAAGEIYTIDPLHTTIEFSAQHMMVSQIKGTFTDYQGIIDFDSANLPSATIDVTIQAKSIDTRNADRDKHLSSSDFLDADKYPTITFKSNSIKKEGNKYLITGDLTIHGITKQIVLPVTINGPVKSAFGPEMLIGLSGQTTINRKDFGIVWNKQMDQGGYVVGEDVLLDINVEAKKK